MSLGESCFHRILTENAVVAMRRIEQENGRMIQAQIRLLKDVPSPLSIEQRERLIEAEQATVNAAFGRFLEWLGKTGDASTDAP